MGYNKPKETTKNYLENTPLPNHGKTYTVVSHKEVIDNTLTILKKSGFIVKKEIYRANMNANIAQGIYYIYPNNSTNDDIINETELGMMFAWTNSYDKSTRFQCAIGAYVKVCYNSVIAGDMMNFKRKHTGSANYDCFIHISDQIKNAEKYYKRIFQDRDTMKCTPLSSNKQAELIGRLFITENLLDTQQVSCIKAELEKPSFHYGITNDNCWTFYNHVAHALKKAHPKDWLQDSQDFHDFIMIECRNKHSNVINEFLKPEIFDNDSIFEEIPIEVIEIDEELSLNFSNNL